MIIDKDLKADYSPKWPRLEYILYSQIVADILYENKSIMRWELIPSVMENPNYKLSLTYRIL